MNEINIEAWVESAPPEQRLFREAVHIVLDSIGHSQDLHAKMVMKGGLLLAIRYDSTRFTSDLDFSTTAHYAEDDAKKILAELERSLSTAEDRLPYETTCRLQSSKVDPKGEGRTHHNLKLKIGLAHKSNRGAMQRLNAKQSADVLEIDYNFNEAVFDVEILELDGGATIRSYSLHNVLAEKIRSLLQQPIRRRNRRQDVYDIWLLLESGPDIQQDDLSKIFEMLVGSCRSKGIEPTEDSLMDDAVQTLAREGYADLQADVADELPDFDVAMGRVNTFYRSLPWP